MYANYVSVTTPVTWAQAYGFSSVTATHMGSYGFSNLTATHVGPPHSNIYGSSQISVGSSLGSHRQPISSHVLSKSSSVQPTSMHFFSDSNKPTDAITWYPDSEVTNHVCNDASLLYGTSEYSTMTPLLMRDGTRANIAHLGHSTKFTSTKRLPLTNVLHVHNIFFEFHPFHYLVKDFQTKEILLHGRTHDRLYRFSLVFSFVTSESIRDPNLCLNNIELENSHIFTFCSTFKLWRRRLGHPSSRVLRSALKFCNIYVTNNNMQHVYFECHRGKSHKLPFFNFYYYLQ